LRVYAIAVVFIRSRKQSIVKCKRRERLCLYVDSVTEESLILFRGLQCQTLAKMFSFSSKVVICFLTAIACVAMIGPALMVAGILWSESLCEEECTCNPDRCCQTLKSCPSQTPCSCLSDENDWMNESCEIKERDCGKWGGLAFAMIILGALATAPLFCLFVSLLHRAIVSVCSSIPDGVEFLFSTFPNTCKILFSRMCMQSSVSAVEVSTIEASSC